MVPAMSRHPRFDRVRESNVGTVVVGPGRDKWPGSPSMSSEDPPEDAEKSVDDHTIGVQEAPASSFPGEADVLPSLQAPPPEAEALARTLKRRQVLRLRVLSAVQAAAIQLEESEVRHLVEQAFENVKARTSNDYA